MPFLPGFLGGGRVTRTYNGSAIALPDDGTPFTFAGVGFGTATLDRLVAIALMGQFSPIASMAIGGAGATRVVSAVNGINTAELWVAPLAAGSSGDVDLGAGSGTFPRLCISSYSIYGASSATPVAIATDITSAYEFALACPANCVAIGAFLNAATSSVTWSGLTEDADALNSNVNYSSASAQDISGNVAGSVLPSAAAAAALCAAAWAP